MKLTFRKWVLNVIAVANPTQYTKSDKYKVKPKIEIGYWGEALFSSDPLRMGRVFSYAA